MYVWFVDTWLVFSSIWLVQTRHNQVVFSSNVVEICVLTMSFWRTVYKSLFFWRTKDEIRKDDHNFIELPLYVTCYCNTIILDHCELLFLGQFKLMTEMFHITHSALHTGLTTTLQHYNSIYRSDMFNILSAWGTSFPLACNPVSKIEISWCSVFGRLLLRNMMGVGVGGGFWVRFLSQSFSCMWSFKLSGITRELLKWNKVLLKKRKLESNFWWVKWIENVDLGRLRKMAVVLSACQGHSVVLRDKALYSHSASLHPGLLANC